MNDSGGSGSAKLLSQPPEPGLSADVLWSAAARFCLELFRLLLRRSPGAIGRGPRLAIGGVGSTGNGRNDGHTNSDRERIWSTMPPGSGGSSSSACDAMSRSQHFYACTLMSYTSKQDNEALARSPRTR